MAEYDLHECEQLISLCEKLEVVLNCMLLLNFPQASGNGKDSAASPIQSSASRNLLSKK